MRTELVYTKVYKICALSMQVPFSPSHGRRGLHFAQPLINCGPASTEEPTWHLPLEAVATAAAGTAANPRSNVNETFSSARGDRVNRAYEKLRELIVWGKLAPGTRIVEIEIADRLRISRTPVRSALHRLQQEGYILASDGGKQSRLSVAPLTREDARELFGIVGLVEGLAARWAAEWEPALRERLAGELRQLNADLLRAARDARPDHQLIFDLDTTFHRRYVEAGAGPRLLSLHDAVKPQAERYVRLYVSALVDEIGTSVEEHAEIIGAIAAGEPELSQRMVEKNWRNAAERFAQVIDSLGERGSW